MAAPVVCAPVFDDWESAMTLVARLDSEAATLGPMRVLLVDDGSIAPAPTALRETPKHLAKVEVLHLRRNMGHQRAIALGLASLHRGEPGEAVVVMDSDGEDRPEDVRALVTKLRDEGGARVVFARRARRSEGIVFRTAYALFQMVHRVLVGTKVEVGNFSAIPWRLLDRVVATSEIWNHYAAGVFQARIPIAKVPLARGTRYAGRSQMSFFSLVTLGMSAVSVYGDRVGVRMLFVTVCLTALTLAGIAAVVAIRLFTTLAIPGWATSAAGLLLVLLVNLGMLCVTFVIFILQSRTASSFLLLRDWEYFVAGRTTLHG